MYRITIEKTDGEQVTKVYEQSIEELNLLALITAINRKPRKSRARSQQKSDGAPQS